MQQPGDSRLADGMLLIATRSGSSGHAANPLRGRCHCRVLRRKVHSTPAAAIMHESEWNHPNQRQHLLGQ